MEPNCGEVPKERFKRGQGFITCRCYTVASCFQLGCRATHRLRELSLQNKASRSSHCCFNGDTCSSIRVRAQLYAVMVSIVRAVGLNAMCVVCDVNELPE